jgi:hypothetical protein
MTGERLLPAPVQLGKLIGDILTARSKTARRIASKTPLKIKPPSPAAARAV